MLAAASLRQVSVGVGAGVATGATLAVPTVLHALDADTHHDGTASGAARAAAGIVSVMVLPAGLLIGSAATANPSLRHAMQAAAAGVEMGYWGVGSMRELAA
jgi:hypothetical protein